MGWLIKCNGKCGVDTWAGNIDELIRNHRDNNGWFLCQCGKHGYIEKSFDLQEPGETWEPCLRGIIPLGADGDTYQPFVFLVSYEPDGRSCTWGNRDLMSFCLYGTVNPKILREANL